MNAFQSRFEEALRAFADGAPILLTDDHDREDEADLVVHAEKINAGHMAMMIRDCSGIVCLCLTARQADRLALPDMVSRNESAHQTHFTVSIDAGTGITTGVSAHDRLQTVRSAVAGTATARDLVRPGHVFPLVAAAGGLAQRRGHTEGSIELAMLAGLSPVAVICELMNPDGSMARGQAIADYANRHHLHCISIADIVRYRSLYR